MKHLKSLLMAVPAVLMAASCSQEEPPVPDNHTGNGATQEVVISFNINTGNINRSDTRGSYDYSQVCFIPKAGDAYFDENPGKNFAPPRELDCENSWQQVNDVKIYTYKEDNEGVFRYTGQSYTVTDFTNKFDPSFKGGAPTATWCGAASAGSYTQEAYYLTVRDEFAHGRYKFLAIGRDDNGNGDKLTIAGLTEGAALEEVTATGTAAGNRHQTSEFFWKVAQTASGEHLIYTVDDTTPTLSVNIGKVNRAVAGLLFYVENIPAEQKGADGNYYTVDYIGVATTSYADATSPVKDLSEGKTSYSAAGKFAHNFGMASLDAFVVEDGYYVRATPYSKSHPNALLVGSYVMPQGNAGLTATKDADNLTNALYLVYYHKNVTTGTLEPISWIPVKDGETDSYAFRLEANHLYTLGTKCYTPDGSGYDDPEEDDKPVDLRVMDSNSDLVIRICPYYEQSHFIPIN